MMKNSHGPASCSSQLQYLHRMGIAVWVRRGRAETTPEQAVKIVAGVGAKTPTRSFAAPASATGADPKQLNKTDIMGLDWEALRECVLHCKRCRLHETRTQGVFGVGSPHAHLMLIGEAPGAEEDRRGEPFVGRAGKLLDEMLRAIGLVRETVYITNVLKSRPPDNRDPRPDEVAACEPYLQRQLELVSPRVILALGRVAAQNLLKTAKPLGRLRGEWHSYGPRATPLLVTYHPAYLLRNPADKHKAWQDLKQVRQRLCDEMSAAKEGAP